MAKLVALKMAYTTVVIACMLMAASHHHVDASITCAEITALLTPCIPYALILMLTHLYHALRSQPCWLHASPTRSSEGPYRLPTVCCEAVTTLDDNSNTVEEDRAACSCIMSGLSLIPGINYDLVSTLPEKCNHTCPYTITATTDCSK
ncbi:hypothetical protein FH972_011828 [Carpinus fangiana]|uniref:Bifunctional inhibitor/plant lipid transfer protein/seed storage helical domain-containing protein n=1 Tax=Carpinus fangiana TaxID=176857 RepID=A0A660KZI3_9ROSI|nr:hypothetical protein FH972_011828 [Carpinus fangiana]